MAIQFACACGEPLSFPDEQSGNAAACPRCGAALTVPRVGLFVAAGDRLPPPAPTLPGAEKPVPVAAPYAPPPRPPVPVAAPFAPPPTTPDAPPRRRRGAWLATAVLLLACGALPFLLPSTAPAPPKLPDQGVPPPDEGPTPPVAQLGRVGEGPSREKEQGIRPLDPPHLPAPPDQPPPHEEPQADPIRLQRLRAEGQVTEPLAKDIRRELRLLRAEQAERRAEVQELRRQLDKLRAETSADAVRSVEEAAAGEPGETTFDRLAARGRAALAERDYDGAVRELTRAAALDPDDADVRDLLEAARAAQDKVNKEVPPGLDKAKDALFAGDVEAAKNIYAVLLLVAPKDGRVRDAVGRLQARMAKGELPVGESRWLTAEEIEALNDRPPSPPRQWWQMGGVNPEATARAIAYGRAYRVGVGELTERGRAAGRGHDDALRGETDRADRAGREHDAGTDEQGRRVWSAWGSGMIGLAEGTARAGLAWREARTAWDEQDARLARINHELERVWRQQDQRAHDGAAGQMIGLLQQHGRITAAVRQHDMLLREQGGRVVGGGGVVWVEQNERIGRAGRDVDAGLRLLIGRAEEAGRRIDDGLRAQGDPGRAAHQPGGPEVGDRLRTGARAGRENLAGQGERFGDGRPDTEIDERARAAFGRLTARELEDRLKWGARDQRLVVETRHSAEVQPPPEPEAPPTPPRVEDPAEKEKDRDAAERALEERNRKAREAAELRRLLDERERRQRDLDELKKLLAEKEAQRREADELKLLRAEKERLQRLRDGFKGIAEDPKKE